MRKSVVAAMSMGILLGGAVSTGSAQGPAETSPMVCEEKLAESTVYAENLSTKRTVIEKQLAAEQVKVYMLTQQVKKLQQELTKATAPAKSQGATP